MKSQDFRVGNYIEYNEGREIFKVIGIHEFGLDVESDEESTYMEFDQFSPIPITEKWLIDFGFDCKNPVLFSTGWDEDVCLSDIPTNIKYVHQFQNLYFSLTGEELNRVTA